jgi:hypothetical protein
MTLKCYFFYFYGFFFFPFRIGDGEDFWTVSDESYDSFDAMGLQENLLRGIYAYGEFNLLFNISYFYDIFLIFKSGKFCYSLSWLLEFIVLTWNSQ